MNQIFADPTAQAARAMGRGTLIAVSSGLAVAVAAAGTPAAMADAPSNDVLTLAAVTTPEGAVAAAAAEVPTVQVDATATWSLDSMADGITAEASAVATSSRDTERAPIPVEQLIVSALDSQGYTTSNVNLRSGPGANYELVGSMSRYNTFQITGESGGWYRISYNGGDAWVAGYLTNQGEAPAAPAAPAASSSSPSVASAGGTSDFGNTVVAIARQYLGTPYVWGGSTPAGFDCSGFTSYVFGQMGISLPHSSSGQRSYGYEVSYAEARPGDLVWYPGHVGIYTGNGNVIAARQPGTPLSEGNMWYRSDWRFYRLGG